MQTAKLFANGRSQAVRLPAAFRFEGDTVYIRRDENGGVVLSAKPADWQGFNAAARELAGKSMERTQGSNERGLTGISAMRRYMLDTNAVNHALKQHPAFMGKLSARPMAAVCISAVTRAEIAYSLSKRPDAVKLHKAVVEFLKRIDTLPYTEQDAAHYGPFKAAAEQQGRSLPALDMLIAAHTNGNGLILVGHDGVFGKIDGPLKIGLPEDHV